MGNAHVAAPRASHCMRWARRELDGHLGMIAGYSVQRLLGVTLEPD